MRSPDSQSSSDSTQFGPKVDVKRGGRLRRLLAFMGPAYLVSIGYMDPGNWATDIEGGARFGYMLIWVLIMSNLMALLLQTLAARLGIVTGLDLAQGCKREYAPPLNYFLWILAEVAIAATDLAEIIGTVIGLNMLFRLPLLWGCAVTACDTFLFLALQRLGMRKMESFILMLVGTIGFCFLIEVYLARPDWTAVAGGLVPHMNESALFVAIGMIGATVMPHNLYLHSSLVQSRAVSNTFTGKKEACKFNLLDSAVALNVALLVNVAILILAAAVFFRNGIVVTEIQQAQGLLSGLLGSRWAPIAFGVALLAAGQSSTLTGTLSGQIIMEGFLNLRMQPWIRRFFTRALALLPAVIAISLAGDHGLYKLLILSQVILSLQLPFATIPLIHFTSDPQKMGPFANKLWIKVLAWCIAAVVITLNMILLWNAVLPWLVFAPAWAVALVLLGGALVLSVLVYLIFRPFFNPGGKWESIVTTGGHEVASSITPVTIRHIGVALEHTPGDAVVVSTAVTEARVHKAKITFVHVVDSPGTMMLGEESSSLHSAEDEAYLETLTQEVETRDLPVEFMLLYGHPARELIRTAREAGFDMMVMGAHGHHGIGDIVFGQTVSVVRHALDIPVLVVRSHGREKAQR